MALDRTVHQLPVNEGLFTWSRCSSALAVYSGKQKLPKSIWKVHQGDDCFWIDSSLAYGDLQGYLCVYALKQLIKLVVLYALLDTFYHI